MAAGTAAAFRAVSGRLGVPSPPVPGMSEEQTRMDDLARDLIDVERRPR